MVVGHSVVDDAMKIRMKAMVTKGLTNKKIAEELGIRVATVAYWTPRFRETKRVMPRLASVVNEVILSETFFGEEITGFFEHKDLMYCVTDSGIALAMKDAQLVSKDEVEHIKKLMKRDYEQMKRRMELFGGNENGNK